MMYAARVSTERPALSRDFEEVAAAACATRRASAERISEVRPQGPPIVAATMEPADVVLHPGRCQAPEPTMSALTSPTSAPR